MKTFAILLSTLFLLSFTTTDASKGPKYIIPKDTKKAALIINDAFATALKVAKHKIQPKHIKFAGSKDLQKLIANNKNLSKLQKEYILKDLGNYPELQATIIDLESLTLCEGEGNFVAIIEAGNVQTAVKQVFSTCGIFRCILSDPNGYVRYNCNPTADSIKITQLCTENSELCCVSFYCLESKCPTANCMEENDCNSCN